MANLELIREAIDFGMGALSDGYLNMPSGCDGCPLRDWDNLDDAGDIDCRVEMFRAFIKLHGLDGSENG